MLYTICIATGPIRDWSWLYGEREAYQNSVRNRKQCTDFQTNGLIFIRRTQETLDMYKGLRVLVLILHLSRIEITSLARTRRPKEVGGDIGTLSAKTMC